MDGRVGKSVLEAHARALGEAIRATKKPTSALEEVRRTPEAHVHALEEVVAHHEAHVHALEEVVAHHEAHVHASRRSSHTTKPVPRSRRPSHTKPMRVRSKAKLSMQRRIRVQFRWIQRPSTTSRNCERPLTAISLAMTRQLAV